jgi:hypothetical protein
VVFRGRCRRRNEVVTKLSDQYCADPDYWRVATSGESSFDQRLRRAVIKLSILRFDEVLPDLRLLSIHNPEKKDNTISAIAEAAILGF